MVGLKQKVEILIKKQGILDMKMKWFLWFVGNETRCA